MSHGISKSMLLVIFYIQEVISPEFFKILSILRFLFSDTYQHISTGSPAWSTIDDGRLHATEPAYIYTVAWWRHQMETFSALLAICAGNSPLTGEFPTQRPVTGSFDIFFDQRLNKRLSKQWWGWWFETPSRPVWRHSNGEQWFCIFLLNNTHLKSQSPLVSRLWVQSILCASRSKIYNYSGSVGHFFNELYFS